MYQLGAVAGTHVQHYSIGHMHKTRGPTCSVPSSVNTIITSMCKGNIRLQAQKHQGLPALSTLPPKSNLALSCKQLPCGCDCIAQLQNTEGMVRHTPHFIHSKLQPIKFLVTVTERWHGSRCRRTLSHYDRPFDLHWAHIKTPSLVKILLDEFSFLLVLHATAFCTGSPDIECATN